jgi:hypothetical protein
VKRSPTLEGFKAIFRRPSFGLAEIAWRWSLGFAGLSLFVLGLVEYFDTLPVGAADMFLLRTRQPVLMGRALEHILRGSALRLGEAGLLLGLAFAVAWVAVASLGRAATLQALLNYFVGSASRHEAERPWRLRSLVGLNSFRAAVTLAAAAGYLGAILLAGAVSPNDDPSPGSAFLVFLMVFMLVNLAWLVVNWFLSLASLFVVAEGEDTFGAMAAAADVCRARTGPLMAVSFWFGLGHGGAFFLASSVAVFLLSFLAVLPGGVVLGGVLLVTLAYFAVADSLHVGRLAAYVYIAESHEDLAIPQFVETSPPNDPPSSLRDGRIDPDELILSDLPLPASP